MMHAQCLGQLRVQLLAALQSGLSTYMAGCTRVRLLMPAMRRGSNTLSKVGCLNTRVARQLRLPKIFMRLLESYSR